MKSCIKASTWLMDVGLSKAMLTKTNIPTYDVKMVTCRLVHQSLLCTCHLSTIATAFPLKSHSPCYRRISALQLKQCSKLVVKTCHCYFHFAHVCVAAVLLSDCKIMARLYWLCTPRCMCKWICGKATLSFWEVMWLNALSNHFDHP